MKFAYILTVLMCIPVCAKAEDTILDISATGVFSSCKRIVNQSTRERVFKACIEAAFKEGIKQNTVTNDASEVVDNCANSAYYISLQTECPKEKLDE